MSPSDFLKTTIGDTHSLPPGGVHFQEGPILLVFVVLLLLMATNILVIFVPGNKRG